MTARPRCLALLAGVLALGASAPAAARIGILYDVNAPLVALTGVQPDGRPGLGAADGLFQQQPGRLVLAASRQAWRVSGRPPGADGAPSLVGRDGAAMAALLRDRIMRSGAHLVFLDEMIPAFGVGEGQALDAALAELEHEPSPYGEASLARRVHVYLPPAAIADIGAMPARWQPALSALARAGGVWLEAYTGAAGSIDRAPWSLEQWLSFTGTMSRAFAGAGGDPQRLHLVLTEGDQATQWTGARTGGACAMLANGAGLYRIGASAVEFVSQFRLAFGSGPAADGPAPVSCLPAPLLAPASAQALADLLALDAGGAPLPAGTISATRLVVGAPVEVRLALGPDPLGIAARLGADPATFWASARARVRAFGAGVALTAPLSPGGVVVLPLRPSAFGPLRLRLILDGAPIRAALGPPADLQASLASFGDRVADGLRRLLASPIGWRLDIPLGTATNPRAPALLVGAPPPPPVAARVLAGLAGAGRLRALGLDPLRKRLVVGRVLTAAGRPLPRAPLAIRFPNGTGLRAVASDLGSFRIVLAARAGRLVIGVPGRPGVRAVLTITGARSRLARARR